MTVLERFCSKIKFSPISDCWWWNAGKTKAGYGIFHPSKKEIVYAHRYMYELFNAKIPKKLVVRHSCDHPGCINPEHLVLGTHADNVADKIKKRRHPAHSMTHCKRGHPLTPDNLKSYELKFGLRQCRICDKMYGKKHRQRKRLSR